MNKHQKKKVTWAQTGAVEGREVWLPNQALFSLPFEASSGDTNPQVDDRILELVNAIEDGFKVPGDDEVARMLESCRKLVNPLHRRKFPSWMKEVRSDKAPKVIYQWQYHTTVRMVDSWLVSIMDTNRCKNCGAYLSTACLEHLRKDIKDPKLVTKHHGEVARLCIIVNDYSHRVRKANLNAERIVACPDPHALLQVYLILRLVKSTRELANLVGSACSSTCGW